MLNWMKRRIERSRARCHRGARGRRLEESGFQRAVMHNVKLKETRTHRGGAEGAEGAQRVNA
jgi:hypothetical protein